MWSSPIGRAVIFCLSSGLYMKSMHGNFVMDDNSAIVNNRVVTGEDPASMVWTTNFWGDELGSPHARHHSYRPIVTALFRIEYWLVGPNTTLFHIMNMILYGLCAVLFQITCERVFLGFPNTTSTLSLPDVAFESFAAAAVFAAHPLHVEAVSSIVGRCEIMAANFVLMALLSYAVDAPIWCHMALGYLAILSKEQAATIFAVFLVYDFFALHKYDYSTTDLDALSIKGKKNMRGRKDYPWTRAAITTILGGACVMQRIAMNKGDIVTFDVQTNPASHADAPTRILTQLHYCVLHFWKLLWPATLSFDYSGSCIPLVSSFGDTRNAGLVLFITILAILAWYCMSPVLSWGTKVKLDNNTLARKKKRGNGNKEVTTQAMTQKRGRTKDETPTDPERIWGSLEHRARVGVACAMTVCPFLPASGFFMWIGFTVAERIMFMPSIGFCALLVLLLRPALRAGGTLRVLVQCLLFGIVVAGSWRTVIRTPAWNNAESLYKTALEVYPTNAKAHHNIAHGWMELKIRDEEVEFHMKEAIRVFPEYGTAYINLGVFLARHNREGEACDLWKSAVTTYDNWSSKIKGEFPILLRNYATCTTNLDRIEDRAWLKTHYPSFIKD